MDRRTLLQRSAVAGGILLAGCMGSKADQGPTLEKVETNFYENDEGTLEVSIIVANAGNQPAEGLLLIHATLNGESYERTRSISLDAHETKEFTIPYDVPMSEVENFTPKVSIQQTSP